MASLSQTKCESFGVDCTPTCSQPSTARHQRRRLQSAAAVQVQRGSQSVKRLNTLLECLSEKHSTTATCTSAQLGQPAN